jgi:hypothetical protein
VIGATLAARGARRASRIDPPGAPKIRPFQMKSFLIITVLTLVAGMGVRSTRAQSVYEMPTMTVYKSPRCACCDKWIDYLRDRGLSVVVDRMDPARIKKDFRLPRKLNSCHTAVIDGYLVEGHVPLESIQRLLRERLPVAGIAVPGMPAGSPGMEAPVRHRYIVYAFYRDGGQTVFDRY